MAIPKNIPTVIDFGGDISRGLSQNNFAIDPTVITRTLRFHDTRHRVAAVQNALRAHHKRCLLDRSAYQQQMQAH
jgi:hypothetical protein